MILNDKLFLPSIIHFGAGKIKHLAEISKTKSGCLIVHGKSFTNKKEYGILKEILASDTLFYTHGRNEPTLQDIRELNAFIKINKVKWVAGIGGGSILDLAKASAGLSNASNDPLYYQSGGKIEKEGIPFIAVPTTAGSGAEATINSVIINEKTNDKLSIRDESLLAKEIILDPMLLVDSPPNVIAYSGLDAITQAIEAYFSRFSTWITETFSLKGFELLINNIENAYISTLNDKPDIKSLENILLGSFLTGVAFTNSRLGVVHGLAHPLGTYYTEPHGLVCAICLVPSIEVNRAFVKDKYEVLSKLTGEDLIKKINFLKNIMKITNVFKGKEIIRKKEIIDYTLKSGSTKASPKDINETDIVLMLNQIFNEV